MRLMWQKIAIRTVVRYYTIRARVKVWLAKVSSGS